MSPYPGMTSTTHVHLVYADTNKPVQPGDFMIQPDLISACRKLLCAHALRSQNRTILVKDNAANTIAKLEQGGVFLVNPDKSLMRFSEGMATQ